MRQLVVATLALSLQGVLEFQTGLAQSLPLPPPSQAQQALQQAVQQQPGLRDVIRQRIQQSGLTPDQVRARLQANGYPATLLDSFLAPTQAGQPQAAPNAQSLAAIQALGLQPIAVTVESLPVDTGLVRAAQQAARPETSDAIFGVDVFHRTTTQFLPLLSGPVPRDYKLGPGDVVVVILTGDVELTYTLQVTREGFVLIPQVGQLYVANLTLEQLRDVLHTRLGRVYSGVRRGSGATTHFDISVANLRANQVYVVGEVAQPGAYQISSLGTALTAVYAAGGVTDRANMRAIEIRRGGERVAMLDLYDYLLRGDTRADVRLETGDLVFVPVHGTRVRVTGAVVRPAIYELKAGESLGDLVRAAGGFRADAALNRIAVYRIVPVAQRVPGVPARTVIDVKPAFPAIAIRTVGTAADGDPPLGSFMIPPFNMMDGDSVVVDALPRSGERDYVEIKGNVYQPGRYGLEPRMTLSRLVELAGGFLPATYAGRAHIERLDPADSTRYLIPVELPADSTKPWGRNPTLHDYDVITVYGRPEMREDIYVVITGMVNRPARYPWREGMTLRDLVLKAQGPKIGADLREAELARLPADRTRGQLATTARVPLDSTYLFDRDSAGRYVGPPGVAFPAAGAPEVELQPYDNVLILKQPEFELQRTVEIQGEVQYPGTYALRTKSDRLSDLVRRAGGLTPRAYGAGIRFQRRVNAPGRINIDLPKALEDTMTRDNIILQPGDSIFIPEYIPSVQVTGAVNAPGSVLYKRGAGLQYYVDGAGGFTYAADKDRVSVRYANGEVRTRHKTLFFRSDPAPGPGAEITVPVSDTSHTTNYVSLFGAIAQILASSVAIIVVVTR